MSRPSGKAAAAYAESISQSRPKLFNSDALEIIPVETGCYSTINLVDHPKAIIYSRGLTNCVVVLFKKLNDARRAADVVTMMHFFPNNAYDKETARKNIETALKNFQTHGGTLDHNMAIELFGGSDANPEVRANIIDALNEIGIRFANCVPSISKLARNESCHVFVNEKSSQALKVKRRIEKEAIVSELLPPSSTMPIALLTTIHEQVSAEYKQFTNLRGETLGKLGGMAKGLNLQNMDLVLKSFDEHLGKKSQATSI